MDRHFLAPDLLGVFETPAPDACAVDALLVEFVVAAVTIAPLDGHTSPSGYCGESWSSIASMVLASLRSDSFSSSDSSE